MVAEVQDLRWKEAAGGIKIEALGEQPDHGTAEPRAPRAEETLKERKEHVERVRRRKLTARAWMERRQRGTAAGNSMNIIAALGVRTLGALLSHFRVHGAASTHTMKEPELDTGRLRVTLGCSSRRLDLFFPQLKGLLDVRCDAAYSVAQGIQTPEADIGDRPGSVSRSGCMYIRGCRVRAEGHYHV